MPANVQEPPSDTLRAYLAASCIGHSTLRNQGAKGVIQAARDYLADLDLNRFRHVADQSSYLEVLNDITDELQSTFPRNARHFGAARKAVNLFMREVCYNRFTNQNFDLARLEQFMELPLDSLVAGELRRQKDGKTLPKWPGLIGLTAHVNATYQSFARTLAAKTGETLPTLDMRLWLAATKTLRDKAATTP